MHFRLHPTTEAVPNFHFAKIPKLQDGTGQDSNGDSNSTEMKNMAWRRLITRVFLLFIGKYNEISEGNESNSKKRVLQTIT